MKIYKILFTALLCIQTAVYALPLTIINSTSYPIRADVSFGSGQLQVFIASGTKWAIELDDETFEKISWNGYHQHYSVDIRQDAPRMLHGGAFVIGKDGRCMYDYKQGHGIKFVQGQ